MKSTSLPTNYHDAELSRLDYIIWSLLAEGVCDAKSPFHTPALATLADTGPQVRTVVLRHADPQMRQIGCHTDWRSSKCREIENDNRVSWLFYDRERKIQLRLAGSVTLNKDDEYALKRWKYSSNSSRKCYASPHAPGTPLDEPPAAAIDPESGWRNFSVLLCSVQVMDWLFLSATGHRRAVLALQHDAWVARWVAP